MALGTARGRARRETAGGNGKSPKKPPHRAHLVPPKRMILSPTLQQHCRRRGQGPFPLGSIFLQERETKGKEEGEGAPACQKGLAKTLVRAGYGFKQTTAKTRPPQTPSSSHLPSLSTSSFFWRQNDPFIRLLRAQGCWSPACWDGSCRSCPSAPAASPGLLLTKPKPLGCQKQRVRHHGERQEQPGSLPKDLGACQIWRETQEPAPSLGSR